MVVPGTANMTVAAEPHRRPLVRSTTRSTVSAASASVRMVRGAGGLLSQMRIEAKRHDAAHEGGLEPGAARGGRVDFELDPENLFLAR